MASADSNSDVPPSAELCEAVSRVTHEVLADWASSGADPDRALEEVGAALVDMSFSAPIDQQVVNQLTRATGTALAGWIHKGAVGLPIGPTADPVGACARWIQASVEIVRDPERLEDLLDRFEIVLFEVGRVFRDKPEGVLWKLADCLVAAATVVRRS